MELILLYRLSLALLNLFETFRVVLYSENESAKTSAVSVHENMASFMSLAFFFLLRLCSSKKCIRRDICSVSRVRLILLYRLSLALPHSFEKASAATSAVSVVWEESYCIALIFCSISVKRIRQDICSVSRVRAFPCELSLALFFLFQLCSL